MANRYAVASGDWSNTATWNGGTLPGVGDVVRPSGFTVTIDQNVTVSTLTNSASSPALVGGSFVLTNGVVVNANIIGHGSPALVLFALNTPDSATINGNFEPVFSGSICSRVTGTGVLNINGNLQGHRTANYTSGICVQVQANCTLNVVGNLLPQANTGTNNATISISSVSTVNITGNLYGGSSGTTLNNAILVSAASNIQIIGNVYGGSSSLGTNSGIYHNVGSPNIEVIGNLDVYGNCPAILSTVMPGIIKSSGTLRNVNGIMAVSSMKFYVNSATSTWEMNNPDNSSHFLYSADVSPGMPTATDVRNSVVYGQSGELTGTLIVPNPSNVRKGVPTDATIGTAEVTGEDIIEAMQLSTNPLAERLRNVSTVQTTGDQITALTT